MAFSLRHLIPTLATRAVCFALNVHASPALDEADEVSVRFTVFALRGVDNLVYQPQPEKTPVPLTFYSAYRSPVYTYKGPPRLRFFTGATMNAAPAAVYDIPAGAKTLLLLFSPATDGEGCGAQFTIHGVDDGIESTPAGCFRTINVSGRDYAGNYQDGHLLIPRGVGEAHAAKGRVSLKLATHTQAGWIPCGRHEFSLSPRDRVMLIFYPPASATSLYPLVRRLTDSVPATKDGDAEHVPPVEVDAVE
jgi:hypothetical protein